MKFKPVGKTDYMGFRWYFVYNQDGSPVIIRDTHLAYHAMDKEHAQRMHEQSIRVTQC